WHMHGSPACRSRRLSMTQWTLTDRPNPATCILDKVCIELVDSASRKRKIHDAKQTSLRPAPLLSKGAQSAPESFLKQFHVLRLTFPHRYYLPASPFKNPAMPCVAAHVSF